MHLFFALSHKLLLLDEGEWLISCHAILLQGEEPSVPIYWVGGPKAVLDGENFFPFLHSANLPLILQLSNLLG